MTLKEQLEKLDKDLEKIETKKKELLEKKKKLLASIELEEARKKAMENKKVIDIIQENFGEMTEENMEAFRMFMENHRNEFQQRMSSENLN